MLKRNINLGDGVPADVLGAELADAIGDEADEHLGEVGDLDGFAGRVIRQQAGVFQETGYRGSHVEEVAYALILLGYHREAAAQLRAATPPDADAAEWELERAERLALVARLLEQDPNSAISQLDSWAQQTASAIGVERTRP